jgi:hypothetical protein
VGREGLGRARAAGGRCNVQASAATGRACAFAALVVSSPALIRIHRTWTRCRESSRPGECRRGVDCVGHPCAAGLCAMRAGRGRAVRRCHAFRIPAAGRRGARPRNTGEVRGHPVVRRATDTLTWPPDDSGQVPRGYVHRGEFSRMPVQAQGHRDQGRDDHRCLCATERIDDEKNGTGEDRPAWGAFLGEGGNTSRLVSRHWAPLRIRRGPSHH